MTSPVLVAGGTGRLGRSVVARLVETGQDVRVLVRRQRDVQPQVTFYTGIFGRARGSTRPYATPESSSTARPASRATRR